MIKLIPDVLYDSQIVKFLEFYDRRLSLSSQLEDVEA
jgi:hypothetical protein